MDKEKAIMEVLYSKYGSILEKYERKTNTASKQKTIYQRLVFFFLNAVISCILYIRIQI